MMICLGKMIIAGFFRDVFIFAIFAIALESRKYKTVKDGASRNFKTRNFATISTDKTPHSTGAALIKVNEAQRDLA